MRRLTGDAECVTYLLPCPTLLTGGDNVDLLESVGETTEDDDRPQAHRRVLSLRGDQGLVEIHPVILG